MPEWWEGPLCPDWDDEDSPDYPLDHPRPGGFNSHFAGCEVAGREALGDASAATGLSFDRNMTDQQFSEALTEGEAWGDDAQPRD